MFDIEFDEKQITKIENMLKETPKKVPVVVANTLTETAKYAKRITPTQILKKYTAFRGDISNSLRVVKANSSNLEARVDSSSRQTPLIYFKTTPRKFVYTAPVVTEVKVAESHTLTKKYFVQKMKSGHVGVFRREVKSTDYNGRLPIAQLYGPSVPQMFKNKEVISVVRDKVGNEIENKMMEQIAKEILK